MSLADDVFDTIMCSDVNAKYRSRLAITQKRELEARMMSMSQLIERLENTHRNLTCYCFEQFITYEWSLDKILLPELLRRLKEKESK